MPAPIHFEYGRFAKGFERFPRVAAKYPTVKFIGHAQTWWGNIDRLHRQEELYPAGLVASGLKALARDRNHAREFVARHRNKLLFGADCEHKDLDGPTC
jgi:hypothetical protein